MGGGELIEQISIYGFQAHENLVLTPDVGVTTIIGPSDVGKSSILRAFRWLALNLPSGDHFVRWGGKGSRVEVVVKGIPIVRERSSTDNSYSLGDREFKAFSTGVPSEISAVLGMDDVHFQGQYDGPFWLSNTAGEVSRHLNRIVGLEIMDDVLSKLVSLIRKRNTEIEVVEDRLTSAKKECARWKFAESLNTDLLALEEMHKSLVFLENEIVGLDEAIQVYEENKQNLNRTRKMVDSASKVIGIGEICQQIFSDVAALFAVIQAVESQLKNVSLAAAIPDFREVCAIEECITMAAKLGGLLRAIEQGTFDWRDARGEAERLSKRWGREIGKECPLCGQTIGQ